MKKYQPLTLAALVLALFATVMKAQGYQVTKMPDRQNGRASHRLFLPVVLGSAPAPLYDMTHFMTGDGRLYEVLHSNGSQARHQTQFEPGRFYHTKGNEIKAEWEELWVKGGHLYRGTDTSPGGGLFYTLYAGHEPGTPAGSAWSPRFWRVGDVYKRNAYVVFYHKSDCRIHVSGYQPSWLRFEAFYPAYTFPNGLRLANVVELSWLLREDGEPEESYFYAESYGLVGWGSADRGFSYVNELHQPGERPDNTREVINCLGRVAPRLVASPLLNSGPLPPDYRVK